MPTAAITVTTTRFGELKTDDGHIVDFPKGLLGFENQRRYALISRPESHPFVHLQSMDDPGLAFVVVNPRLFFPHYKVEIDPREIAELSTTDMGRIETWVIVTVPEDRSRMSANLQGPILVNRANNRAKQVVLVHGPYTTRHYLMDELQKHSTSPVDSGCEMEQVTGV
jgi:flagellar assembly factor FliW